MKAYFVSDIHITRPGEDAAIAFETFLRGLIRDTHLSGDAKPTHLFLVGDIFDLWVGDHDYFRETYATIAQLIGALLEAGVEIHYFEGNHDLHLAEFWQDRIGVEVHSDWAQFRLGGREVRVEHGDLINPDDRGYLFLRALLRSRLVRALALGLPSAVVAMIGDRMSRASRTYTSTRKELPAERIRDLIRAHAERVHRDQPFDLLVTGHVHVKDDQIIRINEKSVRSVNLGSWYDGPKAFVLTESGGEFVSL